MDCESPEEKRARLDRKSCKRKLNDLMKKLQTTVTSEEKQILESKINQEKILLDELEKQKKDLKEKKLLNKLEKEKKDFKIKNPKEVSSEQFNRREESKQLKEDDIYGVSSEEEDRKTKSEKNKFIFIFILLLRSNFWW